MPSRRVGGLSGILAKETKYESRRTYGDPDKSQVAMQGKTCWLCNGGDVGAVSVLPRLICGQVRGAFRMQAVGTIENAATHISQKSTFSGLEIRRLKRLSGFS